MAINRFAVGKMRECICYFVALVLYSLIFHLLGYEPDTFGDGWPMFGYYAVLNLLGAPTAAGILAVWNKLDKKNKKQY